MGAEMIQEESIKEYLERTASRAPAPGGGAAAALQLAQATAAGKILLSSLRGEELDQLYSSGFPPPETSQSVSSMHAFAEDLYDVSVQRFALNINETELGVSAIAVPIVRPNGKVLCALTLTGPTSRFIPESVIEGTYIGFDKLDNTITTASNISKILRY